MTSADLRAAGPRKPLEVQASRGFKSLPSAALPLPCSTSERCPSGLRSATGNRVRAERSVAGSNPALSAVSSIPLRGDARAFSQSPARLALRQERDQIVHLIL